MVLQKGCQYVNGDRNLTLASCIKSKHFQFTIVTFDNSNMSYSLCIVVYKVGQHLNLIRKGLKYFYQSPNCQNAWKIEPHLQYIFFNAMFITYLFKSIINSFSAHIKCLFQILNYRLKFWILCVHNKIQHSKFPLKCLNKTVPPLLSCITVFGKKHIVVH